MSRFIMLFVIAVVGWLIYKLYFQKLQQQGKPGMIKIGLIVLGLVFMALAVTGRAHILFALIGAAMTQIMRIAPLLVRFFPAIQQMLNNKRVFTASGGQQSTIRTTLLSVTLDHDTGEVNGEVTGGPYRGQSLADLDIEQLRALYQQCCQQDPEGSRLLHAYVSRTYPDEQFASAQGPGGEQQAANSAVPELAEAREILGVDKDADRKAIVDAHRRLMAKMHPDKGGSTYLAAKINAAKEALLQDLKHNA